MAVPTYLFGTIVQNPGNGQYQIWPSDASGQITRFTTVTIDQPDPAITITGSLNFHLGAATEVLNLLAGDRFLVTSGPVPYLLLTITGATPTDNWRYILS